MYPTHTAHLNLGSNLSSSQPHGANGYPRGQYCFSEYKVNTNIINQPNYFSDSLYLLRSAPILLYLVTVVHNCHFSNISCTSWERPS